ncbi:MAG: UDP-N-acetylmuramate--L-alanine ligase [Clostridiales bacterium]|nr:UDP-N-acetylmuramate--L-alanine ligase [Clostridiales bacterium]
MIISKNNNIDRIINRKLAEGKQPKVYFIGIGGVSVSSLAVASMERGFKSAGSDRNESDLTEMVKRRGADVNIGHDCENVRRFSPDLLVYSAAIHSDNPELVFAHNNGIPCFTRAEYLGYIMSDYNNRIGVSGMHGKSTTTALLSLLFISAGLDPTVEVGAAVAQLGGNCREGGRDFFIYEACEYTDSFLATSPTEVIVTNIETEHLDYFNDLDHILESFAKYIGMSKTAVVNADDPNVLAAADGYKGRLVTFSLGEDKSADYRAENIKWKNGCASFDLIERGEKLTSCELSVVGTHNIYNALAAIASARINGVGADVIASVLPQFTGCARRFERIGILGGGAVVYDDYAHHPSEVEATLEAVSRLGFDRVITVFQPHTFSRLSDFYDSFKEVFLSKKAGDEAIIADIYAARENAADFSVSSEQFAADTGSRYLGGFAEIAGWLEENTRSGDLVITMGAGDVIKLHKLLKFR